MTLPAPRSLDASPRDLLAELGTHRPEPDIVRDCVDLLRGADPADRADLLPYLAGVPGARYPAAGWKDFWPRSWGARALLYVWDDLAAAAVLEGLHDPSWRVAEMCLKVCAVRQLPPGDAAVVLAGHELPRVRAAAIRALGVAGDTEHVAVVEHGLRDDAQEVRRAAGLALDRMRDRLDL